MSRRNLVLLSVLGTGVLGTAITALSLRYGRGTSAPPPGELVVRPTVKEVPAIAESLQIRYSDTLDGLLGRNGVDSATRVAMLTSLNGTFDVRKLRAGAQLTLVRSAAGAVESLGYLIDPDHELQVLRAGDGFRAAVVEVPGTVRTVPVCGTMQGSLFESVARTGEAAELALGVARIFAWDLDFYTDPQNGDGFCLIVEKKEYDNGQPATYQRILAARYDNAGKVYDAYLFPDKDGEARYYSHDGRSLQAAFLRSPMKFEARVSSRFSHRRFHPVLKIYRPHLGTDYAAPVGASVQAIASGRVVFSGRSGGAGNLIKIRHGGGFESQYLHLSRRFVRVGQHVEQGQRIGAVGATGLATGPHLDFRLRKSGRYVDFERLKPPRMTMIGADQMATFEASRSVYAGVMESGIQSTTAVVARGEQPGALPEVD